jgi:folylpolyglutamate synthase/dihydropteroate synthase
VRIGREGPPGRVLVCGSLYLAGEVLKAEKVDAQLL